MEGKPPSPTVNEDKVKKALLVLTNKKLKDVTDDKLKEFMKDKLSPSEIEEVFKRKKAIPPELFQKTNDAIKSESQGESRTARILR